MLLRIWDFGLLLYLFSKANIEICGMWLLKISEQNAAWSLALWDLFWDFGEMHYKDNDPHLSELNLHQLNFHTNQI